MNGTAFDRWLLETLDRDGTFTMFLIVMSETPTTLVPMRSSYLHVVGPDVHWGDMVAMIDAADVSWSAVAIFAAKDETGGPMPDALARRRLGDLEAVVIRDRMTVRRGELFDRLGRRLDLTPVPH